jgi:hypothetical protein
VADQETTDLNRSTASNVLVVEPLVLENLNGMADICINIVLFIDVSDFDDKRLILAPACSHQEREPLPPANAPVMAMEMPATMSPKVLMRLTDINR